MNPLWGGAWSHFPPRGANRMDDKVDVLMLDKALVVVTAALVAIEAVAGTVGS